MCFPLLETVRLFVFSFCWQIVTNHYNPLLTPNVEEFLLSQLPAHVQYLLNGQKHSVMMFYINAILLIRKQGSEKLNNFSRLPRWYDKYLHVGLGYSNNCVLLIKAFYKIPDSQTYSVTLMIFPYFHKANIISQT